MKRLKKILSIVISFLLFLLALDYTAYLRDEAWHVTLKRDLPIGTSMQAARVYLQDEAKQHGIKGLQEDMRPDMRGYTFCNHNHSILVRMTKEGIDGLLMGYVAVRFDEEGRLNRIYTFK